MFLKYIKTSFILLTFVFITACSQKPFFSSNNEYLIEGQTSLAHELLHSAPRYTKDNKHQATVGVIPYRLHNNRIEILLGYEIKDSTWSDFGGKFDDAVDHTFIDALMREYREETGHQTPILTSLDQHILIFYIDKSASREVVYLSLIHI